MVNSYRNTIESLYAGRCNIYEATNTFDPVTKRKSLVWGPVVEGQPCRLSYGSAPSATEGITAGLTQTIKLFIDPDIIVKAGSRIDVTQNGTTVSYEASGQPKKYSNHQEIELTMKDGEA